MTRNIQTAADRAADKAAQSERRDPATLYDFAAFIRLETQADREARAASKAANAAAADVKADPTDPDKAATLATAEARAKFATKAAKKAAKTAPRFNFDLTARDFADAHKKAEAIAEAAITAAKADPAAQMTIYRHITTAAGLLDPEALQTAARHIAKRTAANAVQREGTKTQITIDNAARAREFAQFDLACMVSEAATALTECAKESAATLQAKAATLATAAADLRRIADPDASATAAIYDRIAAAIGKADATEYPDRAKRRAALYTLEATAATARESDRRAFIEAASRAAYMRLNHYLLGMRAIHTKEAPPPLSLSDLDPDVIADPRIFDPDAIDPATADRRALLKRAFREVFDALSPRAAAVLRLRYKGLNTAKIAAALHITPPTVCEHMKAIADATAATLATLAPDAPEAAAASIAAITAGIDAAEAAAIVTAKRKAAEAKRKQAKAEAESEAAGEALRKATEATEAADRAANIAAAIEAAAADLAPVAKRVYNVIKSGVGTRQAARILDRDVKTIAEHKKAITARIAAAVTAAAPDLDPATIAAADLATLLIFAS